MKKEVCEKPVCELCRPAVGLIIGRLVESLFANQLDSTGWDLNIQGTFCSHFPSFSLFSGVSDTEEVRLEVSRFQGEVRK